MIRVQTETRTEMICISDIIKEHCKKCNHEIECGECNYNNVTYELIDLTYSKPVKRWNFKE